MECRLLDTGINNAYYNMAVDDLIMKNYQQGQKGLTVRFYQWSPPGLSLGYFQKATEQIDLKKCKEEKIDLVRRLTGGRTILHDRELTYSIVTAENNGYLPDTILDSYRIISVGIVRALKRLGVQAELKKLEKNKKAPRGFSAACFDAPSWYEVTVGDKKLVGSAQVRKNGVILQHGSIPYKLDADLLFSLFKNSSRKEEILKKKFTQKATDLFAAGGKNLGLTKLKEALIEEWAEEFQVIFVEKELTAAERKEIEKIKEQKYLNKNWNIKY